MANKKITELTELPVAGQNDVLPVVDLTGPETKKIKVSGLKSSLNLTRTDVGLSNVDNTSDANKPVSTATQAALDLKADAADVYTKVESDTNFEPKDPNIQAHIADLANPHQVTKSQVGLDQVDNTSDIDKPISTATQDALNLKEDAANKGAANGYAPLVDGSVPAIYLPSYVDDVIEVASFALLPNPGEASKVYVTLDTHKTYRWSGTTYIEVSPSDVNSVNGKTGIVVLDKTDIGLDQVDNTSDMDKPVSNAVQSALDGKLNIPTGSSDQYVAGDASVQLFPKRAHIYRPVNLSNKYPSVSPINIDNWSSDLFKQVNNNRHFLLSPQNYLKCIWRVNYFSIDIGQYVSTDIGPFADITEANTALFSALNGVNYPRLLITPYYIQDETIPVLRSGFAYNSNFYRLFVNKSVTSFIRSSNTINSVCTAAPYDQNIDTLKNIFANVFGLNPFPSNELWDASHYGVFMKNYKKEQKTKFLKTGRTVEYYIPSKPRHSYNMSTATFEPMSGQVIAFPAGATQILDSTGNKLAPKLLHGPDKRNLLDGSIHAVGLNNGTNLSILLKDYHKNMLCVSGMPSEGNGYYSPPSYNLEAVVIDNKNNEKVYQVPTKVDSVFGDFAMIQYILSGIDLKPIPGSIVKFRLRDRSTNRVGRFAKFILKVVKRGPICVVDNAPNPED